MRGATSWKEPPPRIIPITPGWTPAIINETSNVMEGTTTSHHPNNHRMDSSYYQWGGIYFDHLFLSSPTSPEWTWAINNERSTPFWVASLYAVLFQDFIPGFYSRVCPSSSSLRLTASYELNHVRGIREPLCPAFTFVNNNNNNNNNIQPAAVELVEFLVFVFQRFFIKDLLHHFPLCPRICQRQTDQLFL